MIKNYSPLVLALITVAPLGAQTTWTGTADTDWNNAANWSAGVPGSAVFTGSVTANQPSITENVTPSNITFESAGWTLGSAGNSYLPFNNLSSAGAGVNVIDGRLSFGGNSNTPHTLNIDAGNTLHVTGNFTMNGVQTYSGGGNLVVDGTISSIDGAPLGFNLFLNNAGVTNLSNKLSFASGMGLGGLSDMAVGGYGVIALGSGNFLSPGYDPISPISALTFTSTSNTAGLNLSNGKLIMDLGTSLGINDQVIAGSGLTRSNGMTITGAELALRGTAVQMGSYTLLSESGGSITGTFGSITFNGAPADPGIFSLTYDPGNANIILNVAETIIPEPRAYAAMLGLAVCGLVLMRRRR